MFLSLTCYGIETFQGAPTALSFRNILVDLTLYCLKKMK